MGSEVGVSRELAQRRAKQLHDLRYALSLNLAGPGESGPVGKPLTQLTGEARISFRLRSGPTGDAPVILDFRDLGSDGGRGGGTITDGSIGRLVVNGRLIEQVEQSSGHLILPSDQLREGENEVLIDFVSSIAPAGRPLISFDDPTNGDRFVYLLPVPMDASLAFPCFDQPDLKGRFRLSLTVPAGLEVVSNTAPVGIEPLDAKRTRHTFAESPPLSTYLFSFAVGNFAALTAETDGVPLRLFVRRSQLEQARAEWPAVADLTAAGIRTLVEYLGAPFPFDKYDQVLLPGFPFRGMEHAGATYLREESVLFPTQPTGADRHARTALILHELVHQWFGDLVTMRWFDDLWIKEGFANYLAYATMAALAPGEAGRRDVWKRFHLHHKPAAYAIDRSSGTTPIHQQVPNLIDAKSAYGAIVYQKAPTILRALCFQLGAEVFRAGVQLFLRRHAFSNADWRDLVASFEAVSGRSLARWASAWINEGGMPRLETDWATDEDAPERLRITVKQRDLQQRDRYWPVETQLLIALADGSTRTVRCQFDGPESEPLELQLDQPPRYIFANDEDYGYGSFLLDERSRPAVIADLATISDPLRRLLLLGSLGASVAAGQLSQAEFLRLLLRSIEIEADDDLLLYLLDQLIAVTELMSTPKMSGEIEERLVAEMSGAKTAGRRMLFFRTLRRIATTERATQILLQILTGELSLPGIALTTVDRWQTIATLLALGHPAAPQIMREERRRNQHGEAARMEWITLAARPDQPTKEWYFRQYLRRPSPTGEHHSAPVETALGLTEDWPEDWPEDWLESSLANFNHRNHSALTIGFLRPALAALPQLKRERKIFFILAWLNSFIGGHPPARSLPIVDQFLAEDRLEPDLAAKVRQIADRYRAPD